ncbi:MAG: DNA-processing protein DprA [Bacteroidia bacterium]|nr:DNA-processing protein DprA [Bacteroidia bacterium]MCX7652145.1 DNA-processing protein DprA [Bacteroidia bacterium]MDW8416906.1 DNA-processing protein DprA [Bacteroidia bacterium]
MEELIALITLLQIDGLGGRQVRRLRQLWGALQAIWDVSSAKPMPSLLQKHLSNLSIYRKKAENILHLCDKLRIQVIPYYERDFPPLLEEVSSPPALLYKKGEHSLMGQPLVAVVGTRKPTAYGLRVTEVFVEALVDAGVGIVSGLAYGIDAKAHQVALAKRGKTIAVLAHGLERIYPPAHRRLAEAILAEGAWVSEYPPGSKLHPLNFPHRNRILAGLSHITLVVESRLKGGALFTARAAFEANRPVFAIPGDIFSHASEGAHVLIARHIAQLAYSPQALLEELRVQTERIPLPTSLPSEFKGPESPLHAKIYDLLAEGPKHIDEVCARVGCSITEISHHLLQMEIDGWIRQKPGGFVIREGPPSATS